METLFSNPIHVFLVAPTVIVGAFCLYILIRVGPKFLKMALEGGSIEVIYSPKNVNYIHEYVVEQPKKFKPIELNQKYFIAIYQPNKSNDKEFAVSVVTDSEDKNDYLLRQELHRFTGEYHVAKKVADLYAKNYGLEMRRIFLK